MYRASFGEGRGKGGKGGEGGQGEKCGRV